mmetsp:Transcript_44789/g.101117  ORF Transcript_44789/g.101117 Transcript_44789/m.101117 type:complete len:156 (-) Transcript_44789:351-818(-)
MAEDPEIAAARERMIARRFGGKSAATGGKGTVRRKHKAVHKTATSDDKKLGSTLKKLGVTNIPAIEEVNLFTSDQKVIHFQNPKVQASIAANTYVVSGASETKSFESMLPGILNQVGGDMELIKNAGVLGGAGDGGDDEDDVPDLVENFEEASKN